MTSNSPAKDKIILPLDVPDAAAAVRLVKLVSGAVSFYKVGLELFTRSGPSIIQQVREAAGGDMPCRIFLDLKLHDIPNTVAGAVRAAVALNIEFLTLHLCGGGTMLKAAVEAAAGKTKLLGVTVLTSSDAQTLRETGVDGEVEAQVMRLAALGLESGLCGVVASPLEAGQLRRQFGPDLTIVTPGVRPAGGPGGGDDQRRVLTPGEAVRAGADFLVIGRPIYGAPDPRAAAESIAAKIAANLPPSHE